VLELDAGFEAVSEPADDLLSPAGFDSVDFDSLFDPVFESLDDTEAGFSELELEEDFDA